jgi:SAM-dependent methyltransferase
VFEPQAYRFIGHDRRKIMSVATDYISTALDLQRIDALAQASSQTGSDERSCDTARTRLIEALDVESIDASADLDKLGDLPYGDATLDVVTVGLDAVQERDEAAAAREIVRVCRPGGRIGVACASPGSFLDRIQCSISMYLPAAVNQPGQGFRGTRKSLDKLFGAYAVAQGARDRALTLHFASAEHWLATFRTSYAPLRRAYRVMSPDWRDQFSAELLRLARSFATVVDDGITINCDYLEFLIHTGIAS